MGNFFPLTPELEAVILSGKRKVRFSYQILTCGRDQLITETVTLPFATVRRLATTNGVEDITVRCTRRNMRTGEVETYRPTRTVGQEFFTAFRRIGCQRDVKDVQPLLDEMQRRDQERVAAAPEWLRNIKNFYLRNF